jgi:NAD/NADP transhydrogenase beta subunit
MNLVTLLYLLAAVFFIQALKGLSHPTTSRRGNVFGMTGMVIAVFTTVALIIKVGGDAGALGLGYVLLGLVVGGGIGSYMANRVEMTKMPELVAFMHSMIGLAAVCIAVAEVAEPTPSASFKLQVTRCLRATVSSFSSARSWAPLPSAARSSPLANSLGATNSACSRARPCGLPGSIGST